MSQLENKFWRQRRRSNYMLTTLGIALVLFMLGMLGAIMLKGYDVMTNVEKEYRVIKVLLNDYLAEQLKDELAQKLDSLPYVDEVSYVSKEEAADQGLLKLSEDASDIVLESLKGVNPFLAYFELKINLLHLRQHGLSQIKEFLKDEKAVSRVENVQDVIPGLDQNLKVLRWLGPAIMLILALLGIFLIYTTIRLSIFAQRMNIRTMELIGASRGFIRRPFLWRGILQGLLGAVIATGGVTSLLYLFFVQSGESLAMPILIVLLGGIVLFGLVMGFLGSYRAVNKYLNRNLDELL
ncbi:MAG: permease-like cell division protein FtsX [Bacteroidota bacterium]